MLVLIIFFKKRNLRYAVATLSLFSVWILLNFFTTLFTINFFVESSFGFISNFLVITKYRLAMYYFLLDCSANKKKENLSSMKRSIILRLTYYPLHGGI